MFRNRFRQQAVAAPRPSADAFMMCPVEWLQSQTPGMWQWQVALYQWAYAEAEAVASPSLPDRDLLGVWN